MGVGNWFVLVVSLDRSREAVIKEGTRNENEMQDGAQIVTEKEKKMSELTNEMEKWEKTMPDVRTSKETQLVPIERNHEKKTLRMETAKHLNIFAEFNDWFNSNIANACSEVRKNDDFLSEVKEL